MKRVALLLCTFALGACAAADPVDDDGGSSSVSSQSRISSAASSGASSAAVNTTGLDLMLPAGFSIETFAEGLSGARVIIKDGLGNYWVSRPSAGIVTMLEMQDGKVVRTNDVFRGLRGPHGLAIDPANGGTMLYIAEEHRVSRVPLYSDGDLEEIAPLPTGGRHTTRTLLFGADDRLYVSIGSSCDTCEEEDERRAAVISMQKDGTDQVLVAKGLRNAVFMTRHPSTNDIWVTEMGRDFLGDNLPPEEVNILREGASYGWPFCYGDRIRDASFRPGFNFDCSATVPPHLTMPAHTAPLGLAFVPDAWSGFEHDLLVAMHGSWNSSTKVGYKIVRFPLDAAGNSEGAAVDFISGWLDEGAVRGRPVDLLVTEQGLLMTDDRRGVVYRVWR